MLEGRASSGGAIGRHRMAAVAIGRQKMRGWSRRTRAIASIHSSDFFFEKKMNSEADNRFASFTV